MQNANKSCDGKWDKYMKLRVVKDLTGVRRKVLEDIAEYILIGWQAYRGDQIHRKNSPT